MNHRAVPAVTRAIAILRFLGASEVPLGVNMIAARLNIVPSTCLHILRTLVREELVSFDQDTKHYSLDAGILTLARDALRPGSIGHRVQPFLDDLARKFPVTALAARLVSQDHVVVVSTAGSEKVMRIHVETGSRLPALMSATGRCVAAFGNLDPAGLEKRFAKLRWESPPSFRTWAAEVEQVRRLGYGVDLGNYMSGLTVVAAPVFLAAGPMSHVIVAIGVSEQIERTGITKLARDVRKAAEHFSIRANERTGRRLATR